MAKSYYADYVNHMLRFYVRNQDMTVFKSRVDELNWKHVHSVFTTLTDTEQTIVMCAYGNGSNLHENLKWICTASGIREEIGWGLITKLTQRLATERGLI